MSYTKIVNKFLLDDNKTSLEDAEIGVDLSHEQSLLLNVELLTILSEVKFYIDNIHLDIITKEQIIKDLKFLVGIE